MRVNISGFWGGMMRSVRVILGFLLFLGGQLATVRALTIQVDYTYDTNEFFSAAGNPQGESGAKFARAALEAAAARWSAIIDQPLAAVQVSDDFNDPRIRITHPGTGEELQISSARSAATDSLVQERRPPAPADEYRGGWGIEADVWILYAGARDLGNGHATGGTATGLNWLDVLNDPNGIHNRGFNVGRYSLPVWGGAIAFNFESPYSWNFDHTREPATAEADLYSIALHEIGHALGLNSGEWDDWLIHGNSNFAGENALAQYNADNGLNLDRLLLGPLDHWKEFKIDKDEYRSKIFPAGLPNYTGTIGAGVLQRLLMGPRIPIGQRYEVTNVEVGALQDIGWSVVSGDVVIVAPAEQPKISKDVDGSMAIGWKSIAGASYTVQTSTDGHNWSDVTPPVIARGSSMSWRDGEPGFIDPNPPAPELGAKYYRIISAQDIQAEE